MNYVFKDICRKNLDAIVFHLSDLFLLRTQLPRVPPSPPPRSISIGKLERRAPFVLGARAEQEEERGAWSAGRRLAFRCSGSTCTALGAGERERAINGGSENSVRHIPRTNSSFFPLNLSYRIILVLRSKQAFLAENGSSGQLRWKSVGIFL